MLIDWTYLVVACLPLLVTALPTQDITPFEKRLTLTSYAPYQLACPAGPLISSAASFGQVGSEEAGYIQQRHGKASSSLEAWLSRTNPGFGRPARYPTLGFAVSGGGVRAALVGAGVRRGYDERENASPMGGLLQAMTYESGLSGGAWALGSIIGNNWPTVTDLSNRLWITAFGNGLLNPGGSNLLAGLGTTTGILLDLTSKLTNGYVPTLVDLYGRLLGYMFLNAADGGRSISMSGIQKLSTFQNFEAPYPIMTAIGADINSGQCAPGRNGVQYEFAPFSFGSWDKAVQAFSPMSLIGSAVSDGKAQSCTNNFDNLGLIMGASSNVFGALCSPLAQVAGAEALQQTLQVVFNQVHSTTNAVNYAVFPNPFQGYKGSPGLAGIGDLTLLDGGTTGQNIPLWPMLRRDVDVIFAVDSTSDVNGVFPGGSQLYNTFLEDRAQGLNRMPEIPPMNTIIAQGLNLRTTFFGCNDHSKPTVVYVPNRQYTFDTGTPQPQVQYSAAAIKGFLDNGVKVATSGDAPGFATCMGCAIMQKSGASLPGECSACLRSYCYN